MTVRDEQLPQGTTIREMAMLGGGWAASARYLGITAQSMIKWKKVPDRHVDGVLRLTGYPLWMIRPDLAAARSKRVHKPIQNARAKKGVVHQRQTKGRKP